MIKKADSLGAVMATLVMQKFAERNSRLQVLRWHQSDSADLQMEANFTWIIQGSGVQRFVGFGGDVQVGIQGVIHDNRGDTVLIFKDARRHNAGGVLGALKSSDGYIESCMSEMANNLAQYVVQKTGRRK